MASFVKDIRYALRAFAKRPAFTAVVVLTLGIGIGSNAAIFSVANAVLFEPLPFGSSQAFPIAQPDAVVRARPCGFTSYFTLFSDHSTGGDRNLADTGSQVTSE